MNYLSHFYIDKHIEEPYYIFGNALPDLQRGFSKSYNKKFKRTDPAEQDNHMFMEIHKGIIRHYEVDAIFHNSKSFAENVEIIKRKIQDRIPKLQKAFFAAHILYEMLLDRQIIIEESQWVDAFYEKLGKTDIEVINMFYDHFELKMESTFISKFNQFLSSKYLYHYEDARSLCGALSRVYLRATGTRIDSFSAETLVQIVEDMDEILKHKWRNTFNLI